MSTQAPKQVKCLICGAVFDASVSVCPVCGVGEEHFVPVDTPAAEKPSQAPETAEETAPSHSSERFVIIGTGIAAVAAAEEIRRIHSQASIVMISEEDHLPYLRTALSKEQPLPQVGEKFALHSPEWFSEQGIFILFGRRAMRVLTNRKQIELSDGEVLNYDKCIFATGAQSFVPPIDGRGLGGVFTLRTLTDFEEIARAICPDRRVVVIGGGILGLEAAWQLYLSGCHVTVLELAERLFANRITAAISARIESLAVARGVEIRTGVRISKLEGEDCVRQVILPGEYRAADIVLLCCGTRPRVEVAQEAGLSVDRGIIVNSRMMTGKYGVYACGDCAQIGQELCGMWNTAENMGRFAGRNAAGEDAMYQPCPSPLIMNAFGSMLFVAGDCGVGNRTYQVEQETDGDTGGDKFRYYADGKLCGAVLIGDLSQASTLLQQIETGKTLSSV